MINETVFNLLMGNFLWQAALISLCVYAALKILPSAHARTRYIIAMSGFFGVPLLLIVPFLPTMLPDLSIGLSAQSSPMFTEAAALPVLAESAVTTPVVSESLSPMGAPDAWSWPPVALWFAIIWAVGALLSFARLVSAGLQSHAWLRRARPSHLAQTLSRPARVKYSPDAHAPMLLGLMRPTILVPEDFRLDLECPETGARTRAVLEHEIAHLARRDLWTNFAQRIVLAILWWFAPLYWLNAQISSEREKLCDDMAAITAGQGERSARALANALVDLASRRPTTYSPLLATGIHPRASDLTDRVTRLCTGHHAMTQSSKTLLLATSFAVPLMLAGLTITTPRAFAHPDKAYTHSSMLDISDDQEFLFNAADRGRIDTVRRLLREGVDPNFTIDGDGSPLLVAARSAHYDMVKDILKAGGNPNLVSPSDGTPLIAATWRGDAKVMELLIKNGADVNLGSPGDGNPLIAAAHRNNVEAASLLINNGADVNAVQPGDETPLINAAQGGHLKVAEYLVAKGADVTLGAWAIQYRDGHEVREWRTPLGEATKHGHKKVIAFLRSKGASEADGDADVNANTVIDIHRPSRDKTSAADGSWNIGVESDMDVAGKGVRITLASDPNIAAIGKELAKDGVINSAKEAVSLKVESKRLYVDGESLSRSLTPKYFAMLKEVGVNVSPTTKMHMELEDDYLRVNIGQ